MPIVPIRHTVENGIGSIGLPVPEIEASRARDYGRPLIFRFSHRRRKALTHPLVITEKIRECLNDKKIASSCHQTSEADFTWTLKLEIGFLGEIGLIS